MYELPQELEEKKNLFKEMTKILRSYVPRGIPDFTDHGEMHSGRIEEILKDLIIPTCNGSDNTAIHLNDYECFCMITSCWLHDIGCIVDRENHGIRSAQIVKELLSGTFTTSGIQELEPCIIKIISTHTDTDEDKKKGIVGLSNLIKEMEVKLGEKEQIKKITIKLQLIASLFRLADACDICAIRAPSLVYKLIKDTFKEGKSKKIWLAHSEIVKLAIDSDKYSFSIYVDNKAKAQPVIEKFKKDIEEIKPILNSLKFQYTNIEVIEIGGPDWNID